MKILHIINSLTTGGAEMLMLRLAEALNRKNTENYVCSILQENALEPQFEAAGIPVTFLNGKVRALAQLRSLIRKTQPDIIQCWLYHSSLATEIARTLTFSPCPVFWGIHASIHKLEREKLTTQLVIRSLRWLSSRPTGIIFASSVGRKQHEHLGFPSDKSETIPSGYDLERFQRDVKARQLFRDEINADPGDFVVGMLARYHPMKDHHGFLKAACLFKAAIPNARFVLAGPNVDTNNSELTGRIESLGLEERVHLLGERRDVSTILNGLDLLTTASAYGEAFPVIVGEAMACETPAVVTDVGDSAWLTEEASMIVPPESPEALSNAWLRIAKLSLESQRNLGQQMRQRIIDNYSIDAIAQKYLELYRRALTD